MDLQRAAQPTSLSLVDANSRGLNARKIQKSSSLLVEALPWHHLLKRFSDEMFLLRVYSYFLLLNVMSPLQYISGSLIEGVALDLPSFLFFASPPQRSGQDDPLGPVVIPLDCVSLAPPI